jgi:hypothetical protein
LSLSFVLVEDLETGAQCLFALHTIAKSLIESMRFKAVDAGSILMHGTAKLTGGIDFVSQSVAAAGLPAFIAYGVYVGEVVAPLLVIAGFYSRIGAAVIGINMLFAIGLVHGAEFFTRNQTGGLALELGDVPDHSHRRGADRPGALSHQRQVGG